jgi:hypothetical protein
MLEQMLETDAPNHVTDHIDCMFAQGWWEDPAYAIDLESEIDAAQ